MQIPDQFKLKNTVKYPTSLIIGGVSALGFELADALIEQGGYVVIVDTFTEENVSKLKAFPKDMLISFVDYSSVPHLEEDMRRLDYVFYFNHESTDLTKQVTTQEFLHASNTIDAVLSLAQAFEAKFLLTTAIKAQQLLLSAEDLHLKVSRDTHHIAYTEMELQRYSENLVQEYHDKTELDTRIVRLGELIGEHADFTVHTTFNELIIQAAQNQSLKLYKDGLESEWYIHTLDASYGIIKAQFSKGTIGKIFSLSYENPITHLSIAYKIQDVADYSAELVFVDERNNLPRLGMYKPAPNLQTVGWKPKISFEKAIHQAYLAAKVFVSGEEIHVNKKGESIVAKLKNAVSGAEPQEPDNALSRLIAERNKQEELKKRRIELASNTTTKRRNYKPRTFRERLQNVLWKQYLALGNSFAFIKNRNPLELFSILVIFGVFVVVYIFVIAPIVLLIRDGYTVYLAYQDFEENLANQNYSEARNDADRIETTLASINNTLDFIAPAAGLVTLDDDVETIRASINTYQNFAEGSEEILYFIEPLEEYVQVYESNTQERLSSETYISLLNDGVNYEDLLLEFESREPFAEAGIQKLTNASANVPTQKPSILPEFITNRLIEIDFELNSYQQSLSNLESYRHAPDILGMTNPTTTAIVLVDNSVPRSVGGEIAAVALITMRNGSINDIVVTTPEDIQLEESTFTELAIDNINDYRFAPINTTEVEFQDLASIGDFETFSFHTQNVLSEIYDRNVEGTFVVTLEDFQVLVNANSDENSDILSDLQNAQTLTQKNQEIAQLLASYITSVSNNYSNQFFELVELVSNSFETGNSLLSYSELPIQQLLEDKNANNSLQNSVNQSFEIYSNTIDTTRIVNNSFATSSYDLQYIVGGGGGTSFDVGITPQVANAALDVIICLPNSAIATNVSLELSSNQSQTSKTIAGKQCRVVNTVSSDPLRISWDLDVNLEAGDTLDYEFLLPSVQGQTTEVDAELVFDATIERVSIEPNLIDAQNSFLFADFLLRSTLYTITLEN